MNKQHVGFAEEPVRAILNDYASVTRLVPTRVVSAGSVKLLLNSVKLWRGWLASSGFWGFMQAAPLARKE